MASGFLLFLNKIWKWEREMLVSLLFLYFSSVMTLEVYRLEYFGYFISFLLLYHLATFFGFFFFFVIVIFLGLAFINFVTQLCFNLLQCCFPSLPVPGESGSEDKKSPSVHYLEVLLYLRCVSKHALHIMLIFYNSPAAFWKRWFPLG